MRNRPKIEPGTLIFMSLAAVAVSAWAIRAITERRKGVSILSLSDLPHTDLSFGSVTSLGRHDE